MTLKANMKLKTTLRYALAATTATLALLASVLPSQASGDTLANARNATAIYNDASAAAAAGYELLTDAAGLACIDQAGAGAMGVHFVKGALVQSGVLDAARPQALVYEVEADGQLRLGALEYVVFQSTWDAAHTAPPTLFGQKFMFNPADNRFGLPAFYSLHAWVWKHNPKGSFEPWNPQVNCAAGGANGRAADGADQSIAGTMDMNMDVDMGLVCPMPVLRGAPETQSSPPVSTDGM